MESEDTVQELYRLLRPYIKEHPQKKDSVYEEDVDGVIKDAVDFLVADKFLARIKAHPELPFWKLYGQMVTEDIPEGMLTPPGQEYILDDDEDD
jgi:hypothetical protein